MNLTPLDYDFPLSSEERQRIDRMMRVAALPPHHHGQRSKGGCLLRLSADMVRRWGIREFGAMIKGKVVFSIDHTFLVPDDVIVIEADRDDKGAVFVKLWHEDLPPVRQGEEYPVYRPLLASHFLDVEA